MFHLKTGHFKPFSKALELRMARKFQVEYYNYIQSDSFLCNNNVMHNNVM